MSWVDWAGLAGLLSFLGYGMYHLYWALVRDWDKAAEAWRDDDE